MLCACVDRLCKRERERVGLFSCLYREHVTKYNHLFMRREFLCQHFFTAFFLRVTSTQAALLTPGQREEGQWYSSGGKWVARSQFCQPFLGWCVLEFVICATLHAVFWQFMMFACAKLKCFGCLGPVWVGLFLQLFRLFYTLMLESDVCYNL